MKFTLNEGNASLNKIKKNQYMGAKGHNYKEYSKERKEKLK